LRILLQPHRLRAPRQALRFVAAILLLAGCTFACTPLRAHPIVSTDINRHVTLRVTDDRLEIRYIYEMLEIAAINTARAWDSDGDGRTSAAERDAYAAALAGELSRELHVRLNGNEVPLALDGVRWELGEGAMGLATWKMIARFTGRLPVQTSTAELEYRDDLRPEEVGWKEVVLVAGGSTGVARSSVPSRDRSYELTDYRAISDLPNPKETSASALLRFGADLIPPAARMPNEEAQQITEGAPRQRNAPPRAHTVKPKPLEPSKPVAPPAAVEQGSAPDGRPPNALPRATSPSQPSGTPASFAADWRRYAWPFFKLGVHHIATGFDHLLFLLGLLLLRQSLGRLVAVVTAFTVAHSVTLALAAGGWVTPPGSAVELLIAASIAYVGAVALLRPRTAHGPLIALGFGLVHGFGFAGALREALGGATGGRGWLIALASFNLGIEALQILLVVAVWPVLARLDRVRWSVALRKLLAFVVLSAGLGWVAIRAAALAS
jgi:hypothetical protein